MSFGILGSSIWKGISYFKIHSKYVPNYRKYWYNGDPLKKLYIIKM